MNETVTKKYSSNFKSTTPAMETPVATESETDPWCRLLVYDLTAIVASKPDANQPQLSHRLVPFRTGFGPIFPPLTVDVKQAYARVCEIRGDQMQQRWYCPVCTEFISREEFAMHQKKSTIDCTQGVVETNMQYFCDSCFCGEVTRHAVSNRFEGAYAYVCPLYDLSSCILLDYQRLNRGASGTYNTGIHVSNPGFWRDRLLYMLFREWVGPDKFGSYTRLDSAHVTIADVIVSYLVPLQTRTEHALACMEPRAIHADTQIGMFNMHSAKTCVVSWFSFDGPRLYVGPTACAARVGSIATTLPTTLAIQ